MTQTTATLQEQTRGHSSKKHDLPYFRLEEDAITFKADKRINEHDCWFAGFWKKFLMLVQTEIEEYISIQQ